MRTLKQLRQEVYNIIPGVEGHIYRNTELDRALNNGYIKLQRKGEILKDSLITTVISDQYLYDLTSSIIWIPESPTDSTDVVTEGAEFSATDVTLTVGDGTLFTALQLIKIDDEILQITAISTNNLTVVRAEAGTTAAVHDDGSTIYIGATPNILSIKRVDYDGVIQDPIAQHEISDLSESHGADWYLRGNYLVMNKRTETLKEIKVWIVPFPTELSAVTDTVVQAMKDYEDGLVWFAAVEKVEKHLAQFDSEDDEKIVKKYIGLRNLYKAKWDAELLKCEAGGLQRIGVDFIKPNYVGF